MIVLVGWGAMLLAAAALELLFGPEPIELALLGGVGAGSVAAGVALGLARRPPTEPGAGVPRATDLSLATALTAVGVALMAFGAEAGPWLVLIGAGTTAIGGLGLALERRR